MIAVWWGHVMWFWGLTSASEWPYLFWSGAGSDLTRLALIGGMIKIVQQQAQHHHEMKQMHERHHKELMRRPDEPKP
jgi:hypothetical protein